MIFNTIDKVNLSTDYAFFEELVEIYCKIVREICCKHNYAFADSIIEPSKKVLTELQDMGILANEQHITLLKKKKNECLESVKAICHEISEMDKERLLKMPG